MHAVPLLLAPLLIFNPLNERLLTIAGFSLCVYAGTAALIPRAAPALIRAGLSGKDRLKLNGPVIAESTGVVAGAVYIFAVLLLTPFTLGCTSPICSTSISETVSGIGSLTAHLAGILSILAMIMLGFADDLFDLRWRHKFFLPAIAAVPMLVVYRISKGGTHIALPPVLGLGSSVDLGFAYYVYMAMLAIFSTNCINIYAGVNGLEAGQTAVVCLGVLLNDAIYIFEYRNTSQPALRAHYLSVYFVLPLLAACLALLKFNWSPAKVFVGDTFCYFAGMVLAVVGIEGHFAKTLLALLLPQVFNFLYSMPQLLGIVPCPRHRMPVLNKDGLLLPSRVAVGDKTACRTLVKVLSKFGLIKLWETKDGLEASNMTLINLVLVYSSPIPEPELTKRLLRLQFAACVLVLFARHMLARLLFGQDNI